jgi:hypothetical protein
MPGAPYAEIGDRHPHGGRIVYISRVFRLMTTSRAPNEIISAAALRNFLNSFRKRR